MSLGHHDVVNFIVIHNEHLNSPQQLDFSRLLLQKTDFSQIKGRLAQGSPGWLVGWVSPCQNLPNTQKNGCWLSLSDHIHKWYTFQTTPDQKWGIIGQANLLHSWHWDSVFNYYDMWLILLSSLQPKTGPKLRSPSAVSIPSGGQVRGGLPGCLGLSRGVPWWR